MDYSPDTFDDEELTQMAMDILVDIKSKPTLVSNPSSTLESNTFDLHITSHNNYKNEEELRTKSMPSTLQTSIDPNTLHAAYPKPKLSILSSNQMSFSDSFNVPLPPIPHKNISFESLQSPQQQQQQPPMTILSNVSSNDSFNIPLPPIPAANSNNKNLRNHNHKKKKKKKRDKKQRKLTHKSMHTPPPNHKQHTFKYPDNFMSSHVRPTLMDVPSSHISISPRRKTNIRRQSNIPNFGSDPTVHNDEEKKVKMQPLRKEKSMSKMNENRMNPPYLYGKHSSIYIDFNHQDRKKRKRKKQRKKRSASPGSLRKYKQRQADPNRAKSVVLLANSSQIHESVSDYRIQFKDRHSSTR